MGRVKTAVLTAILLAVPGGADAQRQGTVQQGAQRTFTVGDLTNDKLGRIVASSNYQVSITLPGEVQNVGVNASKQTALVPTVDKSDGRVIYLDVLKPGGFATLNIRLVSQGEPVILKMTVELSKATSGVLTYTITSGAQAKAAAPAPAAVLPVTRPTRGAAAPIVSPRPTVTTTTPPRPATPAIQPSTPARPATAPARLVTAAPSSAPVRPVAAPPAPTRPATAPPQPSASPQPTAAPTRPVMRPGTPAGQDANFINVQDGLRIEVTLPAGQTGGTRTLNYRVSDATTADSISYILMPRATVRGTAQRAEENVTITPGVAQRITGEGVRGTIKLDAAALAGWGAPVLLFEVLPIDTKAQKPLPRRYVGVVVRA